MIQIPPDLAALRNLVKSRLNGGLTWLVVNHPEHGWIGGKHVGGGVFRGA